MILVFFLNKPIYFLEIKVSGEMTWNLAESITLF